MSDNEVVEELEIQEETNLETEVEQEVTEQVEESQEPAEQVTNKQETPSEDEFILDVEATEEAPETLAMRQLRKRNRELEEQLKAKAASTLQDEPLPPKPTLEQFEYDADAFEQALGEWHEKKFIKDTEAKKAEELRNQQAAEWNLKVADFNTKEAIYKEKIPSYEQAKETVVDALDQVKQAIAIKVSKDAPLLIHALGKNPAALEKLSKEQDLAVFVAELIRLEGKLQVKTSKAPPPEKRVTTTGGIPMSKDTYLDKLEQEAERTGDRSKINAYIRQKRLSA